MTPRYRARVLASRMDVASNKGVGRKARTDRWLIPEAMAGDGGCAPHTDDYCSHAKQVNGSWPDPTLRSVRLVRFTRRER